MDQETAKSAGRVPDVWKSAVDRASRQAEHVPIDMDLSAFAAKWEALERLTEARIIQALRVFGLFLHKGERHSVEDACRGRALENRIAT